LEIICEIIFTSLGNFNQFQFIIHSFESEDDRCGNWILFLFSFANFKFFVKLVLVLLKFGGCMQILIILYNFREKKTHSKSLLLYIFYFGINNFFKSGNEKIRLVLMTKFEPIKFCFFCKSNFFERPSLDWQCLSHTYWGFCLVFVSKNTPNTQVHVNLHNNRKF
jgi:hypothetical protein